MDARRKKPDWLKVRIGQGPRYARTMRIVEEFQLHTVCREAQCPNIGECWRHGRATVMILGEACTRNCLFCAVRQDRSGRYDADEPRRVAEAAARMALDDIVITSVTRDDLSDGGAAIWAETIRRVRETLPAATVEVLVPDFGGSSAAFEQVAAAQPDVFGHNMETVASLYALARPQADYRRSLELLERTVRRGLIAKTGIMAGLGETMDELRTLIGDIARTGCEILYIGQYLQPTPRHLPVARYVEPREFDLLREQALQAGLHVTVSGPLVRSSYHSADQAAYVRRRKDGAV
jgi:lipoyl synthase